MNKKKKAVVLLVPGFPANEEDTTCIPFLQQFCLSFSGLCEDIELMVISFQYPFKKQSYIWNGIKIYSVGGKSRKYNRVFTWFKVFIRFFKIQRTYDVIVINSFWITECTYVGQWLARLFHIKHVVCVSGQDALKTNRYLPFINFSKMEIIAMSEGLVKHFQDSTGFRIQHIIPMGIDKAKISLLQEDRVIDILGVGALIPLKNYSLFVEVIKELKNDFPAIEACIIGKGEEAQALKEKIKLDGLENNVELLGELSHPEVFSYMQRSKILLHTSSYEGQSTVITEALANGLTVVCFDIGRMQVDGNVWVCRNKDEMLVKLKGLLSAPLSYESVVPQTSEDTVREFLKVYGTTLPDNIFTSDLFYDSIAGEYDEKMNLNSRNGAIREEVAGYFLDKVKGKSVLDFGGGTGADIGWITANNFEVWFCEPSKGMRDIAISNKNTGEIKFLNAAEIDFRQWNESSFPVKFDGILSNFAAINSIDDIKLLFNRLDGITAPGSHIIAMLLDTTFSGICKYYLRSFLSAFMTNKYPVFITKYNDKKHVAYLHTPHKIRRAIPSSFSYVKIESLKGSGFMLMHYQKYS